MGGLRLRTFPCEELTALFFFFGFTLLVISHFRPSWSIFQEEERQLDGFFDLGCGPWTCLRQAHHTTPTADICTQYAYVSCTLVDAVKFFSVVATVLAAAPLLGLVTVCLNKRAPDVGNDARMGDPKTKFILAKRCAKVGGFCALLSCCLWLALEVQLDEWMASLRNRFAPGVAGTLDEDLSKALWLGPAWHCTFFGGLLMWLGALFAHCMPSMCRHVVYAAEGLPEAKRPAAPNRLKLDGCTLGRPPNPKARVVVRDCVPGAGGTGRLAQII